MSATTISGHTTQDSNLHYIANYGSVLAFELRNNDEGETFVRTKFKNGSAEDSFRTIHLWNHKEDVALTELVYRLNVSTPFCAVPGEFASQLRPILARRCPQCTPMVQGVRSARRTWLQPLCPRRHSHPSAGWKRPPHS